MKYFEQTQQGRSVWWSWIFATWLAIILWMLGQMFLLEGLTSIAGRIDPEIEAGFAEAQNSMIAAESFETYSALTGLAILVGLGGIIGIFATVWLSNKDIHARRHVEAFGEEVPAPSNASLKILTLITVFAVIVSTWLFIRANAMLDGQDYMALMQQALGLSPITFALFLLTFPLGCLGLYLMQKAIHRRSVMSLHNAVGHIRWGRIIEGFALTWIVLGGFAIIGVLTGLIEVRNVFSNERFWGFAIVSLLLIPLQAGAEEVVFRGYFNQGLVHLTRNKWIAFALTSFAFMAMHLSNPEALAGAASGTLPIVMSGYFFFGFAMCLLVWLDDGIETAIGVHAGNNCFAAIVVNYEGSVLPTPSIFLTKSDPVSDAISTILVLSAIVAIIWWRRGGPARSDDTPSIADA